MRSSFEEERHRHLQDVRDVLQTARADAVSALLVLLHLLERKAKCVPELLLAHAEHQPAHAHPAANVFVNWIRDLLGHPATLRGRANPAKPRTNRSNSPDFDRSTSQCPRRPAGGQSWTSRVGPAFYRYRESYPRRNGSPRNCCSR